MFAFCQDTTIGCDQSTVVFVVPFAVSWFCVIDLLGTSNVENAAGMGRQAPERCEVEYSGQGSLLRAKQGCILHLSRR